MIRLLALLSLAVVTLTAEAGAQKYEPLSASVQAALQKTVSDARPQATSFKSSLEAADWLTEMSRRLERRIPAQEYRLELLRSVHYEATRAGLDPQLVLGLMQVESGFRKYAVSSAGARGYMQVMPFWVKLIGQPSDNLFHLRTNLRYGCTILRHYLDIERGDLFRALGRYNGSLGKAEYPDIVRGAWHAHWSYAGGNTPSTTPPNKPSTAPALPSGSSAPLPTPAQATVRPITTHRSQPSPQGTSRCCRQLQ